jgi:predicted TIM-barrel fold metal-dependent hydrolase
MPDGFVAMLNKFYYDTANTSNRYAMGSFRELIALSQLMFGTDYPFGSAANDAKALRDCGFSDAELRAIECENAYRLWPRLKPGS